MPYDKVDKVLHETRVIAMLLFISLVFIIFLFFEPGGLKWSGSAVLTS